MGILSFVDKTQLEPGCSVLLHNKVTHVPYVLLHPLELSSLVASYASCAVFEPTMCHMVAVSKSTFVGIVLAPTPSIQMCFC